MKTGRVEAWYLAYALVGAAAAGLVPMLLPLIVGRRGTPAEIGAVMAALNLGGLAGPAAGDLADRLGARRLLFVAGSLLLAAALAAFRFLDAPIARLLLALAQGTGIAITATIANLLIVERHPQDQWDERIGWLQTFYGAGQVVGLGIVAAIGGQALMTGLWVAAGCAAGAALVLVAALPGEPRRGRRGAARAHAVRAPGASAVPAQGHRHAMILEGLTMLREMRAGGFTLFLLAWFITFGGVAGIFSLYPVLMATLFGVGPGTSSLVFGAAAAVGLLLYSPAGGWSARIGARRVLRRAFDARLAAAVALWVIAVVGRGGWAWAALACFAVTVLAWSLLAVAGTVITARSSGIAEGPAMGLFNATTSLAAVAGSLAAGALAAGLGYSSVFALAAVSVGVGLVMTHRPIGREPARRAA